VGQEMPKLNKSGIQDSQASGNKSSPAQGEGEFEFLLREIEKEPIPERLLDLALKLQRALAARREHPSSEKDSQHQGR